MTAMWHANPASISLFTISLLVAGINLLAWYQHASLGMPVLLVLSGNFLWLFGFGVAVGMDDYASHLFWTGFQYLGAGILMIGMITYSLNFIGYSRWMNGRSLLLVSAVPVLGALLACTNAWHHLFWTEAHLLHYNGIALMKFDYGPGFWVYLSYNYLVVIFSAVVFWRGPRQPSSQQRWPAALIMLVGILLPLLSNILYLAWLNPFSTLDLSVLGYSVAGLFITGGLLYTFLQDMLAIPRNKLVQDMPDVVLVMDARDRIRDVNTAALKMIGLPEIEIIGQTLQQLRKNDAAELELLRRYQYTLEAQGEVLLEMPGGALHFNFRLTPLYDWTNKLSGRLIVLRDTTELYKRENALKDANTRLEDLNTRLLNEMATRENMQNLVLEQQRNLTTLDERERLGRELHDGLGQVLGYLNMEAQTAQTTLENGDLATLRASLDKIASVARDGHDNVRSFILGLRTASTILAFRDALRLLLEQFGQLSGLCVALEFPEDAPEPVFQWELEVAALQVVREALTNVRKHSAAQRVIVKTVFDGELARVEIADNGRGFDAEAWHAGGSNAAHYGLAMMREQIEKVGGRFEIQSKLGSGTSIIAWLPCLAVQTDADDLRTARGLRILLVDDHPLFLEGLRNLLKSRGLMVVGLAHDGLEAQSMAEALRPDVVVMDVNMPGCDGLEATRLIKLALPATQVLILTVSEDEDSLYEAMKNGASGYLPKSLDAKEFVRLLASLSRGETPLTAGMALRLMRKFDRRGHLEPHPEKNSERPMYLTDRQWLILQSVAQGQKYKEIALQLRLSERTVKREMGQVLELLHIENRKDLANFARVRN